MSSPLIISPLRIFQNLHLTSFSSNLRLSTTMRQQADEQHYRSFVGQLEQKGVDLSHVKIAKSVLVSTSQPRLSRTDSQLTADTMGPIKVLSLHKSKQRPSFQIQSSTSPLSQTNRKGEISRTRRECSKRRTRSSRTNAESTRGGKGT
jgi:hypothetical protein